MDKPGLVLDSGEFVPAEELNLPLRMPALSRAHSLKYNEIRYITGWPEEYIKTYAQEWHKAESAKERCELTAAHVQAIKAAGLELPKNCWIVFDGPGAFDAPEAAQKALEDEVAAAGGLDTWKAKKPHQTPPTMTHEAIFHRLLKVVFNKKMQGHIMGMFREALKEAIDLPEHETNDKSMRSRSDAWLEIVKVLDEVNPGWMLTGLTATESAILAIRRHANGG